MPNTPASKGNDKYLKDNVITIQVNKPDELDEEGVWSDQKNIGGFPWALYVGKEEEDGIDHLTVDLISYKDKECKMWFCEVSCQFFLIDQKDNSATYYSEWESIHFGVTDVESNECFLLKKMADVLDSNVGFLKNDSIIVGATVKILRGSGDLFRKRIMYDPYSPSKTSDGILNIGGKKKYVSKQLLAINSPFFETLFFGDFKEKNQEEIELKDVEHEEFEVLLRMLYHTDASFDENNVDSILHLADKFAINSITDEAEEFLISEMGDEEEEWEESTLLHLAGKYKLHCLMNYVISKLTKKSICELKESEEYKGFTEKTKDLIFEKYIQLDK